MGEFVKEMAQRCEQLTTSASSMLKDIKTTAARYRKEGKRIFNEIESCSSATDEVRQLCETFRDKIATKSRRGSDMIVYWAVPYLLVAALPIIVLLAVMLGGCTMTRTAGDTAHEARFYSDPNSRAGEELKKELERREARAELQRIVDEAQR